MLVLPHAATTQMPKRKPARTTPRRSGQVTARVYERLRDQVLDGVYPQGMHISIQSVATSMATSNGPASPDA